MLFKKVSLHYIIILNKYIDFDKKRIATFLSIIGDLLVFIRDSLNFPLLYISLSFIDTLFSINHIGCNSLYCINRYPTTMKKVFEASNLMRTFHGFNNMIALWFLDSPQTSLLCFPFLTILN